MEPPLGMTGADVARHPGEAAVPALAVRHRFAIARLGRETQIVSKPYVNDAFARKGPLGAGARHLGQGRSPAAMTRSREHQSVR